jgi:hypothetical protein
MIDTNSGGVRCRDLISRSVADSTFPTPVPFLRPFVAALEYSRAIGLTLLVTVAIVVRTFGLGAAGFSEDEVNKVRAVESYRHLDFTANAEHPMMMKLADWASMSAADWWNRQARLASLVSVSPEAALRLPNALVGAATTVVLFC